MRINASDLEFIGDGGRPDVTYRVGDLDTISNNRTTALIVKTVVCNHQDCDGTQHSAIISAEDDGVYNGLAALPCPPHCGGQTGRFCTFYDYQLGV